MSSTEQRRANIEYYLSRGRCPHCGGENPVIPGGKLCTYCREKRLSRLCEKRIERAENGLCTKCGKPCEDKRYRWCEACREDERVRRGKIKAISRKKWYDKQREEGKCVVCGGWAVPGRSRCRGCLDKMNKYHKQYDPTGAKKREYRQKRIEAGLCIDCGRTAVDGKSRCKRCLSARNDSTIKYKIQQRTRREAKKGAI